MTVAVDESEVLALPEEARRVVKRKAGVSPKVVVMNPGLTESFGVWNHEEMKGKDWAGLFEGAKAGVVLAQKEGRFLEVGERVEVEGSKLERWRSAAGSEIEAKLVAIEDGTIFVFETGAGKVIRVKEEQLSVESAKRGHELAE